MAYCGGNDSDSDNDYDDRYPSDYQDYIDGYRIHYDHSDYGQDSDADYDQDSYGDWDSDLDDSDHSDEDPQDDQECYDQMNGSSKYTHFRLIY